MVVPHAAAVTSAFEAALDARDLGAAGEIAYDALIPSLKQTQAAMKQLGPHARTLRVGRDELVAYRAALVVGVAALLDSKLGLDMTLFVAHHARGVSYDAEKTPDAALARAVALAEIALRGHPQALILYQGRVQSEYERIANTLAHLAEVWNRLIPDPKATVAEMDMAVATGFRVLSEAGATFAVTVELIF